MITQSDDSAKVSPLGRARSLRTLWSAVALGSLIAISGCDRVNQGIASAKKALEEHGVLKPSSEPNNPNPAPAPAPAPAPEHDGPIVLTPGETSPDSTTGGDAPSAENPSTENPGETPPPDGGAKPETPTQPETPPQPDKPTTPTSPEAGNTTPPATPTTPGDAVQNAEAAFNNPGKFLYAGVGQLVKGSGEGSKDETIYAPGITFPIKDAPAFLNSQVYGVGGMYGAAGSECSAVNYGYPWHDNFCEKRGGANRASYNCPSKQIHQGQDIRAGDAAFCTKIKKVPAADRKGIEIVAVEDGMIQYIGTFTVDLRAGGRIYRYLHMNMKALKVKLGDSVKKGQQLGYLSNDFGTDANGKPVATTLHLHFEMKQNIDGVGWTWVSPYMSLLAAYKEKHPDAALIQ